MTENELVVEEVRRALGERTNARGFRVFSKPAAAMAVRYAQKRLGDGASAREVAAELGLIGWTLQRWLQREERGEINPGFALLEVKSRPSAEGARLVVFGPSGIRIEGLQIAEVAELLRRLSCSV